MARGKRRVQATLLASKRAAMGLASSTRRSLLQATAAASTVVDAAAEAALRSPQRKKRRPRLNPQPADGSGEEGSGDEASLDGAASRRTLLADWSEPARRRLREIGALALLGFTTFLFLACASAYGSSNWCGPTGDWIASVLLGSFGYAAWMAILCLGLWSKSLFTQQHPENYAVRVSGLFLGMLSLAGLITHLLGNLSGRFPAGGTVGEYIRYQLVEVGGLGSAGTLIVLLFLSLATFVLATDVAYSAWIQKLLARGRKPDAAGLAGSVGALAGVGAANAAPPTGVAGSASGPRGADALVATPAASSGADTTDLEPFKVLENVPGASLPEVLPPRARRTPRTEKPAIADSSALGEKPVAAEKPAAAEKLAAAEKPAPVISPRASEPSPTAAASSAASSSEADLAAAQAGADGGADGGADTGAASAAAAERRRARPVVRPTVSSEPVQLTLYGEPAVPTPTGPSPYSFPGDELLDEQHTVDQAELDTLLAAKTSLLEKTLESFKIEARVVEIQKGPVISMFEMELGPGIKVERVRSLEDDLAIALRARTVRIVAPIPGKNTIGIEVPNPLRETVRLKSLLHCREYTEGKYALPIFLGRDASGRPMIVDLAKMPHLLVAGATGSGKSVCLNSILVSFLYTRTPEQVKLILIDPKMVELTQFAHAPHLACPVISDMKRAPAILEWAIAKMEERYKLLSQAGVRNIYSFNKLGPEGLRPHFGDRVDDPDFPCFLPFIVIVIDELADLMMSSAKEVETSITRLAAKSRAVGIHMIVATQRPSTNVITGLIKANLPTRIAFMVSSKIDSRVILDENGAEQLLGEGDMLVMSPGSAALVRGQGTFLSEDEVRKVMTHVAASGGPAYVPELVQRRSADARDPDEEDDLYDAAARFVFSTERGSASLLQRKFAIGYTRASRLIDMMAEEGVLGEYKGSQARELTMTLEDWIALKPDHRGSADTGDGGGDEAEAG
ncbi:MAG: DNA translocase FtsK [Planctomycetota bacterium]